MQESLTNVTRHAGPAASATVLVRYDSDELTVQVDDDGKGWNRPPADGHRFRPAGRRSGSGVRGMRERVAALGGELTAGPGPGGGFRVLARLPLDDEGSTG